MTSLSYALSCVSFNQRQYVGALGQVSTSSIGTETTKFLNITLLFGVHGHGEKSSKGGEIATLDAFVEPPRGACPLSLPRRLVSDFSFELPYGESERRGRKKETREHIVSRARQKAGHRALQRYQNRLAQAEIDLAFITPSEFKSWYQRFNRNGIQEYDLIELVVNWTQRNRHLNLPQQLDFVSLGEVIPDLYD